MTRAYPDISKPKPSPPFIGRILAFILIVGIVMATAAAAWPHREKPQKNVFKTTNSIARIPSGAAIAGA
jgi:hypothetical protein